MDLKIVKLGDLKILRFILLNFLISILLVSNSYAQTDAPEIEWDNTYGGSKNDWANSIQQTSDGGYIVAGKTYSFSKRSFDFYIIKLDAEGNRIWEKTYGGDKDDVANSIQQTTDGGDIVAGGTTSFGEGEGDFYIIKFDAGGNIGENLE